MKLRKIWKTVRARFCWSNVVAFSLFLNLCYSALWSYVFIQLYLHPDAKVVLIEPNWVILAAEVIVFPVLVGLFLFALVKWLRQ